MASEFYMGFPNTFPCQGRLLARCSCIIVQKLDSWTPLREKFGETNDKKKKKKKKKKEKKKKKKKKKKEKEKKKGNA